MSNRTYTAPVTVAKFLRDDSFFRALKGPVGSGKSVGCAIEVVRRCKEQTKGPDGLRKSRWVVVRNTASQLKDTTLKTWFDWIPSGPAGYWKESDKTFYLEFGDVKAEILFRPLDTPDDVQRVLSLELTGAWINECREIPKEIVEALQARLGRYPSANSGHAGWFGMIADTNPPEIDSFWYKVLEGVPIEEDDPDTIFPCSSYHQPSGLSLDAENVKNLVEGYYERIARGKSKDWIDTYVHGLYSPSLSGVPVYRKSFRLEKHVLASPYTIDGSLPVIVGMDFGRTPAAVFKQMTMSGKVINFGEVVAFDTGLENFIKRRMKPFISNYATTNPLVIIGDPAGVRRNDTDERNCFKMLRDYFPTATVKAARTNDPVARINATEKLLLDYIEGDPAYLIDPRCKWLIEALRSRYRYANVKNRDLNHADRPEKNNWSHVAEANQYGDLFYASGRYDHRDYAPQKSGLPFPFNVGQATPSGPAIYVGY